MSLTTILLILLFAFGAALVQRVSGFGFGILIMSVLPFLMPSLGEATALSGLLALVASSGVAIRCVRDVRWKKLLPILITFILVSFFAVRFMKTADSHLMRKILGGVMILVSIYLAYASGRIHLLPNMKVQLSMGTLSAIMGGLFAMQGPPAVIYFISSTQSKEEYIAQTQWYFMVGNLALTLMRAGNGFITPGVLKGWILGIPAVLLGLWAGAKIYKRIHLATLHKIVYAFMAVCGATMIFL